MARVSKRAQAMADLASIAQYIAHNSPDAALRFLAAAEETFQSLARMPGIGRRWDVRHPRLGDVQCRTISRFSNYLVFYLPTSDGIDVLRVLHGARDLPALLEESGGDVAGDDADDDARGSGYPPVSP